MFRLPVLFWSGNISRAWGTGLVVIGGFFKRATIEVAVFGQNVIWVTGLLSPKSFEFKSCVAIFFGVYLSHGIVHRVAILFSSKISFWEV